MILVRKVSQLRSKPTSHYVYYAVNIKPSEMQSLNEELVNHIWDC
jgi:hypothetical protein